MLSTQTVVLLFLFWRRDAISANRRHYDGSQRRQNGPGKFFASQSFFTPLVRRWLEGRGEGQRIFRKFFSQVSHFLPPCPALALGRRGRRGGTASYCVTPQLL